MYKKIIFLFICFFSFSANAFYESKFGLDYVAYGVQYSIQHRPGSYIWVMPNAVMNALASENKISTSHLPYLSIADSLIGLGLELAGAQPKNSFLKVLTENPLLICGLMYGFYNQNYGKKHLTEHFLYGAGIMGTILFRENILKLQNP